MEYPTEHKAIAKRLPYDVVRQNFSISQACSEIVSEKINAGDGYGWHFDDQLLSDSDGGCWFEFEPDDILLGDQGYHWGDCYCAKLGTVDFEVKVVDCHC